MAGATKGTWVKVVTKTGKTTRFISKYDGGHGYGWGEEITQSEFNKIRSAKDNRLNPKIESSGSVLSELKTNGAFVRGRATLPTLNQGIQKNMVVKGDIIGDFIVHKEGGIRNDYQISHIPSGGAIASSGMIANATGSNRGDIKSAKLIAKRLNDANLNLPQSIQSAKSGSPIKQQKLFDILRSVK